MKKIELSYNPFLEQAKMKVDGILYEPKGGRLEDFLIGQPIQNWLARRVVSYQCWEGLLPELIEFLNDDELEIIFRGTMKDYQNIKEQFAKQQRAVELKGFENNLYSIDFVEKWESKLIYEHLLIFLQNRIVFAPTQKTMMMLENIQNQLTELKNCETDDLKNARKELNKIVDEILMECQDDKYKKSWQNAKRELEQIFL